MLAYRRETEAERLLVALNFTSEDVPLDAAWTDRVVLRTGAPREDRVLGGDEGVILALD